MRSFISLCLVLTVASLGFVDDAHAARKKARRARPASFATACKTVQSFPSTYVYNTRGSDHFSSGDCRKNTVGIILKWGARGYPRSGYDIIDAKGNVIGAVGNYGQSWVGGPARYYACFGYGRSTNLNGSGLARAARRRGKSNNVYFRPTDGSFKNVCYGPVNANNCANSASC